MSLSAGTRLGPYEIIGILGAGGMGEVYRGRDPRIERDVAIKILPSVFAQNADRLRRFEQEAKSAGAINHPNILVIHDFGTHDGSPFLVCEYLEGETLRNRLSGSLSQKRIMDYSKQIASGLAAAHEKGIVHRDLKPENIFIMKDERIKILDFGLAKLIEPESNENRSAIPTSPATEAGLVMGTVGYMSPEQVRGFPADNRTDIFAFGAILYEMITGRRAFNGESNVETMHAILKEDPPDARDINPKLSPALDRILSHCLEKNPEARFQSACDLEFDLDSISETSGKFTGLEKQKDGTRSAAFKWLASALIAAALCAMTFFLTKEFAVKQLTPTQTQSIPDYRRLTFSRGAIQSAKFTPDGNTVIYSSSNRGSVNTQLYDVRTDNVTSRLIGVDNAWILSISSKGQMALSMGGIIRGSKKILAQIPVSGGAPRELMQNVLDADYSPDGENLAVARRLLGKSRLEYPIGKLLFETPDFIKYVSVSPNGNWVAFTTHPFSEDLGRVIIIDLSGRQITNSAQWYPTALAWHPNGKEVWFSTWSLEQAGGGTICALSIDGKKRIVQRFPGNVQLNGIRSDGKVLITINENRQIIHAFLPGKAQEENFSWLDFSILRDISKDGRTILFTEQGDGSGIGGVTGYIRQTDGSEAIRLAGFYLERLSQDGKFALGSDPENMILIPTGAGEMKKFLDKTWTVNFMDWLPGEKEILFSARKGTQPGRLYLQKVSGGDPVPITPEGVEIPSEVYRMLSSDGTTVIVVGKDQKYYLWSLKKNEAQPLVGLEQGENPFQWTADDRSVYVSDFSHLPARVYALEIATGKRRFVHDFVPNDPTGLIAISNIRFLPDEKHYAYDYSLKLGTLYLISGLK